MAVLGQLTFMLAFLAAGIVARRVGVLDDDRTSALTAAAFYRWSRPSASGLDPEAVHTSELGGDEAFASLNVFVTTVASLGTLSVLVWLVG